MKSCVGVLKLKAKQAQKLGLKPRTQLSPLLEKCCLRLAANESYQSAEAEIEALTGVKVGHTTHQRLVLRQDLPLPQALQSVSEASVDAGKVRLRGEPKQGCHWRDYKAVRLQGIYYAAFFDDNQCLIDGSQFSTLDQSIGLFRGWSRWSLEFGQGVGHTSDKAGDPGLVSPERKSL